MLLATAYHEAGHAVAAIAHKKSFRYVTINSQQKGYAGLAKFHNILTEKEFDTLEHDEITPRLKVFFL